MPSHQDLDFFNRLLHRLVFSHPRLQRRIAEIEDDLFATELEAVDASRPVFIAGLPRSGTTLLLRILYDTGEFASLTYRNMPLIMAPILWQRISQRFSRHEASRERDHGDGIQISPDSPEAFEEVLWLNHLSAIIVGENHLTVPESWQVPKTFYGSLRQLMRKVVFLQSELTNTPGLRYLSKNNPNLARIALLVEAFPDSSILVPFRDPLAQAMSLLHQHENFTVRHQQDEFSRKYMQWLGHYDFGLNFKPTKFGSEKSWTDQDDFGDIYSWLRYWVQSYRHSLEQQHTNVHFVDFDQLLATPTKMLTAIGRAVRIRSQERLNRCSRLLRSPKTVTRAISYSDNNLKRDVEDTYQQLKACALS
jgi:hypothetical protein